MASIHDDTASRKKVEEALVASQLQLSDAMDLAHIVCWEVDIATGDFIFNDPFYTLYATTAEREGGYRMAREEYGKRFVHQDDMWRFAEASEKHRQIKENEFLNDMEHRIIRRDGEVRYILARIRVIKDAEGRVIRYYGANQDITERKRTEEALKASEEKYRKIFEGATEGICQTTPEGRCLSMNPAFAKMFGFASPEEMIDSVSNMGQHLYVNPEDREKMVRMLIEHDKVKGYEVEVYRKDRSRFWISINIHTVRDTAGNILYFEGTNTDITTRKKAEEAIANEREKLKTLSDNAPFGMVLINKDGRFTYINTKFTDLFGFDPSDIPDGRTWFRMAYPDIEYRHTVISTWVEDLGDARPGERKPRVFTITCKDGTQKIANLITSILVSGDYLMICEDITEKRNLESQLRQAQKMESLGTLAGGIARDFNNILTALMGYAALIQIKMEKSNPLKTYADQIISASKKAADLTHSLLAFSRQQPTNLVPLDINSTIKTTKKLLKRLLTEDIELHTSLTNDDTTVMADKSQIDQILFNLVTNARDAMPKGGTIAIETFIADIDNRFIRFHGIREPGRYVLINVSDTGIGMDEVTREKIFDPFFTTKEVGKGTGLGLATVYGIVKQHNGYITLESTPNMGTTFHIYIPVVMKKADPEEGKTTAITMGDETVLIVEDNKEARCFIREALQYSGYKTIEAVDGEDGIYKFKQNLNVDLVILDLVMPKKNGREAYEEIHKINPHIKVLFTSGHTKEVVLDKGIEDKEFDFIAKPLSLNEFLQKVREVLDR
ncbi:MAG: PAS domain S-box protein [Proteobacteria bacterium]|nr:PAS domain S-box protein [Pseudomonadota bacterium]